MNFSNAPIELAAPERASQTAIDACSMRNRSALDARRMPLDSWRCTAPVAFVYNPLDYAAQEPPTFVVVGEHDGIAPPSAMERRIAALREAGTEVEYRKYKDLGHGFGLGTGTSAEGWIGDAIRFWERFTKKSK